MKSLFSKYSNYLLQLSKKDLLSQLNHFNIPPPIKDNKKSYIESILLSAKTQSIKARLQALEEEDKKSKEDRPHALQLDLSRKMDQLLSAESKKVEDKIMNIQRHLENELAEQFKASKTIDVLMQENESLRNNIFGIEEIEIRRLPILNQLLNSQNQIRLHPSKVSMSHHRNVGQLLDSFVTYKSEEYLQNKEKQLYRRMLPRQTDVKGNCIPNILMLYSSRKEEEFLQDTQDPLENLLYSSKSGGSSHQLINGICNKIFLRGAYYRAIISSLDFESLHFLVKFVSEVNRMPEVATLSICSSLLRLVEMVRNNSKHFRHPYYKTLLSMSLNDNEIKLPKLEVRNKMYQIEGWILSSIQQFRMFAENFPLRKDLQLEFMRHVVIYKELKRKIIRDLVQEESSQEERDSYIARMEKELEEFMLTDKADIWNVFELTENEQFNQKIQEIILFFSPNRAPEAILQQLSLYQLILHYIVELQQMELGADLFNKIVKDNIFLLQHSLGLPFKNVVDSQYIYNIIQLTLKLSSYVNKTDFAAMFVAIWQHYKSIHSSQDIMSPGQGKSFIQLTRLGSHLGKVHESVKQYIFSGQQYLLFLNRYIELLVEGKQQSADKKAIVDMLKEDVLSLIAPSSS